MYSKKVFDRANTTAQWSERDSLENYKSTTGTGLNLYSDSDIIYKYNNHGFRCDNFEGKSELPILFIGCSFTEGIGVPAEQIWSNLLLEKIKTKTQKKIPYWSVSISAAGVDTIATNLYWFYKTFNKKVKYVVGLFPGSARREFKYNTTNYRLWMNANESYNSDCSSLIDPVFSDEEFALCQSERSLMLIDSLVENLDAKLVYSNWKLFENVCSDDHFFKKQLSTHRYIDYPDPTIYQLDYARDGDHPGPTMHNKIAEYFWDQYFKKELEND